MRLVGQAGGMHTSMMIMDQLLSLIIVGLIDEYLSKAKKLKNLTRD